jgi:uncharacterized protein (DUF433 family)
MTHNSYSSPKWLGRLISGTDVDDSVRSNSESWSRHREIHENNNRPAPDGRLACIRGLRIPVAIVVAMIADGISEAEILSAYPDLERDDVREALRYAADAVRERELPLILP